MKQSFRTMAHIFLLNLRSVFYINAPAVEVNNFNIRLFKLKDLIQISSLSRKAFPEHRVSWKRVLFWAVFGRRLIVVAERNGFVAGYNSYRFSGFDVDRGSIHGTALAVKEEFRGKNLAADLRFFAWSHFARNHVTGVTSFIPEEKDAAIRAATKSGYEIHDRVWRRRTNRWEYFCFKRFE
ncbi:GNAT family N-acetyltransferase [Ectothiorhodospira variabilis]|uniref:GNAT family N-acetyltransferase n=1 Tax=Ectothiorhodospira variabilis TaxID=505694 RepID=UPI001EFA73C3|nr:GNAT family N-acetyltransferase [Ectothiorhodospira variabilis]MCG5495462.1 hypothetical protein [Ectothiorhodospira variabilis]MCG5505060.1 hypothetical protein [Ectothiorhodospira variabilis]MCG5508217.1 hypothetical protein [Ectothiorhodospira variabilis]